MSCNALGTGESEMTPARQFLISCALFAVIAVRWEPSHDRCVRVDVSEDMLLQWAL